MSEHDPLCRYEVDGLGPVEWCDCELIAKVRDSQRGFDIRQQVEERDAFRAKIEALRAKNRTRDWDYFSALDDVLALFDAEVSDG